MPHIWSRFILLKVAFLLLNATFCVASSSTASPIVIMVSFDGFRYDYLDKYKDALPTLRKLAREGVRADFVRNVFPTETFPNHYTLVTGLYPEHHGIIGNEMYDPVFDDIFTMKTNDSRWWDWGEPIWVTSEKQDMKSGVCFWPGYDVVIKGHQPTYRPMNSSYGRPYVDEENILPWKDRIDMAIKWLNGSDPPSVVLLYFNEPDEEGHKFGVDSIQMRNVLKKLDNNTLYLMEQLKQLDSFDRINIILTGDHGMMNFNSSMYLDIDQYINPESYISWCNSSLRMLITNSSTSTLEELYHTCKIAENITKAFNVYKKEEIPEYLHYRHNRRIADILVVMKPHFLINSSIHYVKTLKKNHTYGLHGYSPVVPEMHQYLIAYGPAFKTGYRSDPIYAVDLYTLMCHMLGIKPAKNDGDFDRISHILKSSNWVLNVIKSHKMMVIAIACTTLGLFSVAILYLISRRCCKYNDDLGTIRFTNRRKENFERPLMESDDEDEIVIM